jgi:hypothetical protein
MTNAQALLLVGLVAIAFAGWMTRLNVQVMVLPSGGGGYVVTDRWLGRAMVCLPDHCSPFYPPKSN